MPSPDRRPSLPVLDTAPPPVRGFDRRRDRRIAFAGLALAVAFLVGSLAALGVLADGALAIWLPLHLALAGAAGTAVAAMLPFFVAALSVAPPAPAPLRAASIGLVAGGVLVAGLGRGLGSGPGWLAATGAMLYVTGIGAVFVSAVMPLRRATGPRRPASVAAYAVGLIDVAIGVSLAAIFLAGGADAAARWASLKPAHAWLNLFGFLPLVIGGTLLHFAPTVAGSRIRRRPVGVFSAAALGVAAPLAAAGFAIGSDALAVIGAGLSIAGAAALTAHGWQAHRARAAWSTEQDWHRYTAVSLLAAPAWLLVATLVAGAEVLRGGAGPGGWVLTPLLGPMVAGFVVQVLLGALSFLVPAVSRTTPGRHAAMRHSLGRQATLRLVAWNGGVTVLSLGLGLDAWVIAAAGVAALVTTIGATVILLGLSLLEAR
ncbi:MAG TPA: hypothetical protein VF494_03445 [Candidatus Limnocylindrales bacterium]